MRSAVKAAPSRPKKAAPANRGYGQPGKAKHDPAKHPRGPDGRFITSGDPAKPKTPRTKKATAPKPPRKVGTPKQRKGLADQIRKARAAAKTPAERKALLGAVRDLRAKRAQWQRGQGLGAQVKPLPKPPKAEKPKKEKVQEKAREATAKRGGKKAGTGDLRTHAESLSTLKPSEQKAKLLEFIRQHDGPAASIQEHGMAQPEAMRSIRYGEHTLHFPATEAGRVAAAGTARALTLGNPVHPEVARHTRDIYLTSQANSRDGYWGQKYGIKDFQSSATGGDGSIVVYHGSYLSESTYAHEAGHNMATARYGSTSPRATGDYAKAAASGEKPPTDYATKSPAEDFAESLRIYTHDNAAFARSNPLRYKVVKRMLEDPTYGG